MSHRPSAHAGYGSQQYGDERMHFVEESFFSSGDGEQRKSGCIENHDHRVGNPLHKTMQEENYGPAGECYRRIALVSKCAGWDVADEQVAKNSSR